MATSSATITGRGHQVYISKLLILLALISVGVALGDNLVQSKHLDGRDNRKASLIGKKDQSEVPDDCKHSSHGPSNSATRQQHQTGQEGGSKGQHGKHESGELESFSMEATGLGDLEEPDAIRVMVRGKKSRPPVSADQSSKTQAFDQRDNKTITNTELAHLIRLLVGTSKLPGAPKLIGSTDKANFLSSSKPALVTSNRLLNTYYGQTRARDNLAQLLHKSNLPKYRQAPSLMILPGDRRLEALAKMINLSSLSGQQQQQQPARAQTLAIALSGGGGGFGGTRRSKKYFLETNPIVIERRTVESTFSDSEPGELSATTTDAASKGQEQQQQQQEILDENNDGEYNSRFSLLTTRKIQPDEIIIDGSTIELVGADDEVANSNGLARARVDGDSEQQIAIAGPLMSSQIGEPLKLANQKQAGQSLEQLSTLISASPNYLPRIARASFM